MEEGKHLALYHLQYIGAFQTKILTESLSFLQEALVQDLEGAEKNVKQLKGHLKDLVQAASGVAPSTRGRSDMPDSNGMVARMSH